MMTFDINEIPEKIKSGIITKEEALHQLVIFVLNNKNVFNLIDVSEDLLNDIILSLLEKGTSFLDIYDPDYGKFFTFFYCHVKSSFYSRKRTFSIKNAQEEHIIFEEKIKYEEVASPPPLYKYSEYIVSEKEKKNNSNKDLQLACKCDRYRIKKFLNENPQRNESEDKSLIRERLKKLSPIMAERILLILTLKSSYYINDKQILLISEILDLDFLNLQEIIQKLKNNLLNRAERKKSIENRRNRAYYKHRLYKNKIILFEENEYLKRDNQNKYDKYTDYWISLNKILEKGILQLKPSNKKIAEYLGICERQVSYYIKKARVLGIDI